MVHAPNVVLKGLIEGLVLLAIEREPTHGYAILKDLEDITGEAPNKNQVYPLLSRLEDDGLITSEEVDDDQRTKQVYRLTEEGEARLAEFRAITPEFKHWLVELFGIPPRDELVRDLEAAGRVEEVERLEGRRPGPRPDARAGWVNARVRDLPMSPPVKAPFAEVSLNRNPGTGEWTLTVSHHEPGNYEGADVCPLTYLYLASQRLLFQRPEP